MNKSYLSDIWVSLSKSLSVQCRSRRPLNVRLWADSFSRFHLFLSWLLRRPWCDDSLSNRCMTCRMCWCHPQHGGSCASRNNGFTRKHLAHTVFTFSVFAQVYNILSKQLQQLFHSSQVMSDDHLTPLIELSCFRTAEIPLHKSHFYERGSQKKSL